MRKQSRKRMPNEPFAARVRQETMLVAERKCPMPDRTCAARMKVELFLFSGELSAQLSAKC